MNKFSKLLLSSFFLALLAFLLGVFVKVGYFRAFDLNILHFFQARQPYWLIILNKFLSIFDVSVLLVVLPLFFYLRSKKKMPEAKMFLLVVLSWFLMILLKGWVFTVGCPTAKDAQLLSFFPKSHYNDNPVSSFLTWFLALPYCYPSGHVFDSITVYGTIFYLRKQLTNNKSLQKVFGVLCTLVIILMGQSRISLAAHWPSDVVGGYLFGFAWLFLLIEVYNRTLKRKNT